MGTVFVVRRHFMHNHLDFKSSMLQDIISVDSVVTSILNCLKVSRVGAIFSNFVLEEP